MDPYAPEMRYKENNDSDESIFYQWTRLSTIYESLTTDKLPMKRGLYIHFEQYLFPGVKCICFLRLEVRNSVW